MAKKQSGDECQRCHAYGEDRRTLWMACMYQMMELGLPLENTEVFDIDEKHLKRTKRRRICVSQSYTIEGGLGPKRRIPYNEDIVRARGRVLPRNMYTMRVCKDCRASWMDAIKRWFENVIPELNVVDLRAQGSGIFVRRNGANVEISEEEWYRLNPGREPVRAL